MNNRIRRGFTLIEMSIVLVIIGLIVGSILVGQDMMAAAAVRATISQLDKFTTAANGFYDKYGYLPGDIPAVPAAQFGFAARGQYAGEGDGNGILEGNYGNCSTCDSGVAQGAGETAMFWVDLSTAHLIDGSFSAASAWTCPTSTVTPTTSPSLNAYLPAAKLNRGNYILAYSGYNGGMNNTYYQAVNYFQIIRMSSIQANCGYLSNTTSFGLSVRQAYSIDTKMDDGLPGTGAVYMEEQETGGYYSNNAAVAVPASSTSCFDNGNTAGTALQYSVSQSGGNNVNCELSFQMKATGGN